MSRVLDVAVRPVGVGFSYSQWWGEGGNSEGWATVELAKLLNAAEDGLIQSGTRFEFN